MNKNGNHINYYLLLNTIGNAEWILGMKIVRDRSNGTLFLNQEVYLEKVINSFYMSECKPASTPEIVGVTLSKLDSPVTIDDIVAMKHIPMENIVGSLLYAALCTRPDIAHAVNIISRFMKTPGKKHWIAAKHIVRYLKGTKTLGLTFKKQVTTNNNSENNNDNTCLNMIGYSDSDWGNNIDTRKSTTGFCISLDGNMIGWCSKGQATVALSTAEAEYMAISATIQEILWIQSLIKEIFNINSQNQGQGQGKLKNVTLSTLLYCDNQSALAISKNDISHQRTKHIDIRHHFVRDCIAHHVLTIDYIPSGNNLADLFTKPLSKYTFHFL